MLLSPLRATRRQPRGSQVPLQWLLPAPLQDPLSVQTISPALYLPTACHFTAPVWVCRDRAVLFFFIRVTHSAHSVRSVHPETSQASGQVHPSCPFLAIPSVTGKQNGTALSQYRRIASHKKGERNNQVPAPLGPQLPPGALSTFHASLSSPAGETASHGVKKRKGILHSLKRSLEHIPRAPRDSLWRPCVLTGKRVCTSARFDRMCMMTGSYTCRKVFLSHMPQKGHLQSRL